MVIETNHNEIGPTPILETTNTNDTNLTSTTNGTNSTAIDDAQRSRPRKIRTPTKYLDYITR